MSDVATVRCFVGLPPDDVVRADLADVIEPVAWEGFRKVAVDNLHLTLKFLGDVEHAMVEPVLAAVQAIVASQEPFDLNLLGLILLPNPRRPRVLAATTDAPPALLRLVECLEEQAVELGFRREGRAFRPHITLGRFRRAPRQAPQLADLDLPDTGFRVDRVVVYESVLEAAGPIYLPMGDFPLAASGGE
ncbi:MAG: RNA 2',3'-cyclic phosphodiesterase [Phycisphaerae bacterium]|nr:RNA 2',3'-cyclic phosphodiesterase [Phycisphaerae bacterium]